MLKQFFKILRWMIPALLLFSLLLAMLSPSLPVVPTTPQDLESFEQKLKELAAAHEQKTPLEVHVNQAELNSFLQSRLPRAHPQETSLQDVVLELTGDTLTCTTMVDFKGKNLFLIIRGNLGVEGPNLKFVPTGLQMGRLPIPLVLVESTLVDKLREAAAGNTLRLPEFIQEVRVQDGRLDLATRP